MKVEAYRNLHNGKYSVKAMEGPNKGRVVLHCDYLELGDVKFVVSQSGRNRVLKERKKYVHATVRGTLGKFTGKQPKPFEHGHVVQGDYFVEAIAEEMDAFTYNPFKFTTFVDAETHEPLANASEAILSTKTGTKYSKGSI